MLIVSLRRPACFAAVLFLLAAATGCGKGKVSGTVAGPDGQPLPLGRITFHPPSGPAVTGDIQDGKYAVQNVPTGETKVTLDTSYVKEEATAALTTGTSAAQGQPRGGAARPQFEEMNRKAAEGREHAKEQLAKYREVPEKYTKPDTSGLSLTVKAGDNTFDVSAK